jgi:Globin
MLDRQRKTVQSTVPVLQEHGETITRVFYRHLLEEHPELASMFNARDQSDGSQARRLAAAVLAFASNIDRLHMLESAITSIGRKHISLNVRPERTCRDSLGLRTRGGPNARWVATCLEKVKLPAERVLHIDHLFARMQRLNTYEARTNAMTRIGSNLSQVLPPPFSCE